MLLAHRADGALPRSRRVADPYRWLEDDDSQETQRWLDGQEALRLQALPAMDRCRVAFRDVMQELTDVGSALSPVVGVPVRRESRRFYLHCQPGQDLAVLMVADEQTGSARVLIDPLTDDASGTTTLAAWRPSWTGRLLAYQLSRGGSEQPELRLLDVATGRDVAQPIHPGRLTPIAWLPDDSGYYYVKGGATEAEQQICLHRLARASSGSSDVPVFRTRMRQLTVMVSGDGRWLIVSCSAGARSGNDLYLAELNTASHDPAAPQLQKIFDGTTDNAQALLKVGTSELMYAITTRDAADGQIFRVNPEQPNYAVWQPIITPAPGNVITGCAALTEPTNGQPRLLVATSANGHPQLSLHDQDGRLLADIPTPTNGPATISTLASAQAEPGRARFVFTDFLTPPKVYRFDLADQTIQPDAPETGVHHFATDAPEAAVHRMRYTSDDGTEIPLYLIVPAGYTHGPRPTILTAYGGFRATISATYTPSLLAWVRAGGIYAIAGVRGGGEYGSAWHAAGRHHNKPNAFADFSAAARWLHAQGWTTRQQLAVRGGSHSGLTAAVALTQDPHLYAAVVCSDALTDMIRYPHLGIGSWWINEFGDPDNPTDRHTLLSYSPYHNVRAGTAYPAVLVTSARHDDRVGAAHSRKLTAALQHATAATKPILLRTEHNVGHGDRATSRLIDLHADILAFCAIHTGLRPAACIRSNLPGQAQ
uniref:prolyl oligopeptidase n=1 Tax=Mycobacterium riyadhense TaxID=486698 RepID=A0A653EGD6_9MYCO|nr:Prolyl endopeptidase precursor [Mycobacterium riyadhense]